MVELHLDDIDRKLVNLVQEEFPLTAAPYHDLGLRLGIGGDRVIERITRLRAEKIIRLIGPVLDARSLGYLTTLVAMRVAPERQAEAERIIAEHPGVSHGYERDHRFNIWFTLAAPAASIEAELKQLTESIRAEAAFSLPALKVFKLRVHFDMGEDSQETVVGYAPTGGVGLSEEDRVVIRELPQDLPLVAAPFSGVAERAGMAVAEYLSRCLSLVERGVMRRFGAAINHRKAGYTANGMTCWVVPSDRVNAIGQRLASLREVSHCYERQTNNLWRHNLFAMIHSRTRAGCEEIIGRVSAETGLHDYVVLFSTREFKKTRVRYRV